MNAVRKLQKILEHFWSLSYIIYKIVGKYLRKIRLNLLLVPVQVLLYITVTQKIVTKRITTCAETCV